MSSSMMWDYLTPESPEPVFSDEQWLAALLAFESGLAHAEAECGLIPQAAAEGIARACESVHLDRDAFVRLARQSGAVGIALTRPLQQWLAEHAPESAAWLHWGSTTQDAVDTANVLLTQSAMRQLLGSLDGLCAQLERLAREHAATPMMARSLMQPAQVTSFGFKCAQMAHALRRSYAHLQSHAVLDFNVQLGGAVGNRASLGAAASAVEQALARRLNLGVAGGAWHTQREPWMRVGMEVAVLCGSLAKLAKDWALMSQFEVGELSEASRGSTSSAMPHKRNPVHCMQAVAHTQVVPQIAATLLACMPHAHERALGEWQAEVAAWASLWQHAIAACRALEEAAAGLHVNTQRMLGNIEALQEVIFSESFVQALAPLLGKAQASTLVATQSEAALATSRPLSELLAQWLAEHLDAGDASLQAVAAIRQAADLQVAVSASATACEQLIQTLCVESTNDVIHS